ncbi:LPXTG cell wall anchor domain-containing protein [Actinoplanes friuliensis]|uniref:Gram-positive cocci surface proteins LPxTG domain-containing protein n=1 Tax=Actinoplanes friuliensis DSM 7358 TaxID=1246995 RepID=U5WDJ1_9ACTN|nr:LPXTG cell wall anchor domain-containing protein [Actinoplanes friuliensis]AGZ46021.1 hypothetical protein AFR_38835 [Actinoplanes friuliensis DSM 7358]
MATLLHRTAAATAALTLGVLGLGGPAAAAPPASYDETIGFYNQAGRDAIAPGSSVTFVITSGYDFIPPQQKKVVVELPDGVTFTKADSPYASGPCVADATGSVVTCTNIVDPAQKGSQANWWVTTKVADDVPEGTSLTAKATLTTELPDPDPANNVESWTLLVNTGGDMSVTISAPPGPWQIGSKFTARITIHNNGPYRAMASMKTSINPVELGNSGWPANCGADAGSSTCTFDDPIDAGGSLVLDIKITVPARADGDDITLAPEIYPTAPDPNGENNTASYHAKLIRATTSPSPSPSPTTTPAVPDDNQAGDEPSLPITGSSTAPLAVAGLSLLTAGAAALLLARRRRTR